MTKISIFVFSYYLEDTRVRKQCELLSEKGHIVDVYCLRRVGETKFEFKNGVRINRVGFERRLTGRSKFRYIVEYLRFFVICLFINISRLRSAKLIIFHNMPNFLIFSATFSRLINVPIILDVHDLMPELILSKDFESGRFLYRLLLLEERYSHRFATTRITVNKPISKFLQERTGVNYDVIHNGPLISRINPKRKNIRASSLVFLGNIHERYGLDKIIVNFAALIQRIEDITLDIYGDGPHLEAIKDKIRNGGLEDRIFCHGKYEPDDVEKILSNHAIGIALLDKNLQNDLSIPVKTTEYIMNSTPFLCTDLHTVRHYFPEGGMVYVDDGDTEQIQAAIYDLVTNHQKYVKSLRHSQKIISDINWEIDSEKFISIIDRNLEQS